MEGYWLDWYVSERRTATGFCDKVKEPFMKVYYLAIFHLLLLGLWTSSIFNITKRTQHSRNCVPGPEKQGFSQALDVQCLRPGHPKYEALKLWLQQTCLYFTLDYKRNSQFFIRRYLKSNYVLDYFVTCLSLSSSTIWIKEWKESATQLYALNPATCPSYLWYSGSFNLYFMFTENQIKCHKIVRHKRKQVIFV